MNDKFGSEWEVTPCPFKFMGKKIEINVFGMEIGTPYKIHWNDEDLIFIRPNQSDDVNVYKLSPGRDSNSPMNAYESIGYKG